jgi:hypothetical protein
MKELISVNTYIFEFVSSPFVSMTHSLKIWIDLLLVDIPKGLSIPFVFDPASMIPIWNWPLKDYVETIFFFAKHFLSKRGGIILFYLDDLWVQKEIVSFVDAYKLP